MAYVSSPVRLIAYLRGPRHHSSKGESDICYMQSSVNPEHLVKLSKVSPEWYMLVHCVFNELLEIYGLTPIS